MELETLHQGTFVELLGAHNTIKSGHSLVHFAVFSDNKFSEGSPKDMTLKSGFIGLEVPKENTPFRGKTWCVTLYTHNTEK